MSDVTVDWGRSWESANEEANKLRAERDALAAENERLRLLIATHNIGCEAVCGLGEQAGVACGYRPYFPRRCPDCARDWMIDIGAKEPTT